MLGDNYQGSVSGTQERRQRPQEGVKPGDPPPPQAQSPGAHRVLKTRRGSCPESRTSRPDLEGRWGPGRRGRLRAARQHPLGRGRGAPPSSAHKERNHTQATVAFRHCCTAVRALGPLPHPHTPLPAPVHRRPVRPWPGQSPPPGVPSPGPLPQSQPLSSMRAGVGHYE